MNDLDPHFQAWLESLPIGFINYLYQVYKFNEQFQAEHRAVNRSITPAERDFIDRLTVELNKRIKNN